MRFCTVLIVDDHERFRRLIHSTLSQRTDFQIVGEASDGADALEKAQELQPDLVLMDLGLPKLNGMDATRRIRTLVPHARILIISQESSGDVVRESLRSGAAGYVHKAYVHSDLLPAIEAVLRDQIFVSEGLGFIDGSHASAMSDRIDGISASLMRLSSLPDLLDGILDAGIEIAGADFGNIQLCNPEGNALKLVAQHGFGPEFVRYFEVVHYGANCVCGTALKVRRQVIVEDVSTDPIFGDTEARTVMLNASAGACQSTPLYIANGELFGMLNTHHRRPYRPPDGTLQLLDRFAHQAAELIKRISSQP